MRILVCGGRNFDDSTLVFATLDALFPSTDDIETWLPPSDTVIIHGGARGADLLGDSWAVTNWVRIEEYRADWEKYGKSAGYIRNKQMLVEGKPDLVIAFPGGKGTAMMVKIAKDAGIEVKEVI